MKKYLSHILTAVFAAIFSCILTCYVFFLVSSGNYTLQDKLNDIQSIINNSAVFEFSAEDAEWNAVAAYLQGLEDDYVYYWTKEEYEDYYSSTQGNFVGMGVVLRSEPVITDGLFVYQVYGNSPAEKAGLKPGDRITAVDGVSILGEEYEKVYDSLAGIPGRVVTLTVRNGDSDRAVKVEYAAFIQSYVSHRKIGEIGFVRILSFTEPAVAEFSSAISDLLSQGIKGLIIDVRNNPGGSLAAVESMLELFVPKGEELVVLKFKNSETIDYSKVDPIVTDIPITVLINGSSMSASELMASALRDVCSANLVGDQSFGKGIGQSFFKLRDGSYIKLTTFHYLTKNRVYYHGTGLVPDVSVSLSEDQLDYFYALDEQDDLQLQAALATFNNKN